MDSETITYTFKNVESVFIIRCTQSVKKSKLNSEPYIEYTHTIPNIPCMNKVMLIHESTLDISMEIKRLMSSRQSIWSDYESRLG